MAALNGHTECVQLLLDLMANVSATTIQDGTTIDMIGNFMLEQSALSLRSCRRLSYIYRHSLKHVLCFTVARDLSHQCLSWIYPCVQLYRLECIKRWLLFLPWDFSDGPSQWFHNFCIGTGAGSTALHYAACGGSIPCCQVKYLVEYGILFYIIAPLSEPFY
jgi:hypothetical protein